MRNRLWAITTYYNYFGTPYRTSNYWNFRNNLQIPLILVEYSLNKQYLLGPEAADIYVPVSGKSLIWQKERLLNHALLYLPEEAEFIAWIDCDLIFPHDQWVDECLEKLSTYRMVQLFNRVTHLPKDSDSYTNHSPERPFFEKGLAATIKAGADIDDAIYVSPKRSCGNIVNGMAWAADLRLLQATGFYDACIVGGGDTAMAAAAFGKFEAAINGHSMNSFQREFYLAWANNFWKQVRGSVTALDQDIYHLWHGSMGSRRSKERHQRLSGTGFDPYSDIEVDGNGAWTFKNKNGNLRAFLREYFRTRDNNCEPIVY